MSDVLPTRNVRGIACMVASGAFLTLNDAMVKLMTEGYPLGEIMFFRGVFVFVPIGLLAWRAGGWAAFAVRDWRGQGLRAGATIASSYLFLGGLKFLPLADAVAINFCGPLFITALAAPMLGEAVGWRRWSAICVGFGGVLVMVQPGAGMVQWYAALPILAAVVGAVRDIWTRRLAATETSVAILAVTTAAVGFSGLFTLPFGWLVPTFDDLAVIGGAGLLLGCAHFLMIEAYRWGEAAAVAPFKYTNLLWAVVFGFLFWRHLPDSWIVGGSALVVGSGLYVFHRETRRARLAAPSPG